MSSSDSSHSRTRKKLIVPKVRFFWLLVALIGFILAVPSLPASDRGVEESMVLISLIFFAAIYVSQGVNRFWAIGGLILLIFAGIAVHLRWHDSLTTDLFTLFALLLALGYTSVCVLGFVLDEGNVTAEHIYGAICAYVLLAMAFGTLYTMLEFVQPDSFSGVHARAVIDRPWWQFFYFSFTTLSTVGYGDITPATMRARSFVIIEQLIAIFYVAILIARITGMYKSQKES